MRTASFIFVVTAILVYAGCKKVQPIPDKLQGYWQLVKTQNLATLVVQTNLSGNCLHFTNKEWSRSCKTGTKETGRKYFFTPDANDPTKGTLEFEGRKIDPELYTISWSGDTLIMTPPSEVYDIKYYLPQ